MNANTFFTFYTLFLIWAVAYRVRRLIKSYQRPVGTRGRVYASASYGMLLASYVSIAFASIAEYFFFRNGKIILPVSLTGLVLFLAVIPLRNRAISALGDNMSPEIEIKYNHRLVTTGPYRYLRHPLSLCVILELTGFVLVSNSFYALLLIPTAFVPVILMRLRLEEKALLNKFGQEFLEYKNSAYAFWPFKKSGGEKGLSR